MHAEQVSRRGFLAAGVTTTGVVASASLVGCAASHTSSSGGTDDDCDTHLFLENEVIQFDGPRQAGVETPVQAYVSLVGFRFNDGIAGEDVRRLLRMWTNDARAIAQGEVPPGSLEPELFGSTANLTVTCGLGPAFFRKVGAESLRPAGMADIPAFPRDALEPRWGQADVALQLCADDQLIIAIALRHLTRIAKAYVTTMFIQEGFHAARGARGASSTPRNLFGQLDGSKNPHTPEEFNNQVWIDEGPDYLQGSTVMVVRRINMNLDTWEELDRQSRENAIGRHLSDGTPLTGGGEFDDVDLTARDETGLPIIDPNSHVARAMPPAEHPEQRLLRRAYTFSRQPDPDRPGELSNAGLVFICFQKDSETQFSAIQARLDERDLLNTWITHVGSGVYWVPPGVGDGRDEFWAQRLIDAAS